jgi:D-alanine-D-alanine ligase-like ATP-grasp enzyme
MADPEKTGKKTAEPRITYTSALIAEIAPSLGFTVNLEPIYGRIGQLIAPDGKHFYFGGTGELHAFDLNTLGATAIAKDKAHTAHFLSQLGYPVPEGRQFYPDKWSRITRSGADKNAALAYAHELGFPVIVKPNSRSLGIGVQLVDNDGDFSLAVDRVFENVRDKVVLVQRPIIGDDYRILILDKEVIAAYRRSPLSVIGDGESTIEELVIRKRERFREIGRNTRIKLGDPRIPVKLKRMDLGLSSVLDSGQKVSLLDNANLSSGGEAEDITEALSESHKEMAIRLTADMGLRLCGLDIITPEPIDQPLGNYTVIEINAYPGMDYYTQAGLEQQPAIRGLYKKLLAALLKPQSR